MKFKNVVELENGMWARLGNGKIFKFSSTSNGDSIHNRAYASALLDMNVEWFPPVISGYRVATAEDRREPKFKGMLVCHRSEHAWSDRIHMDRPWMPDCEYLIPEPKTYLIFDPDNGCVHSTTLFVCVDASDFQVGDRVRVEKVG